MSPDLLCTAIDEVEAARFLLICGSDATVSEALRILEQAVRDLEAYMGPGHLNPFGEESDGEPEASSSGSD